MIHVSETISAKSRRTMDGLPMATDDPHDPTPHDPTPHSPTLARPLILEELLNLSMSQTSRDLTK